MENAREKKVWGCDSLQVWLGLGGRELRWIAARDLDSAAGSFVSSLAVGRDDQGAVREEFFWRDRVNAPRPVGSLRAFVRGRESEQGATPKTMVAQKPTTPAVA